MVGLIIGIERWNASKWHSMIYLTVTDKSLVINAYAFISEIFHKYVI